MPDSAPAVFVAYITVNALSSGIERRYVIDHPLFYGMTQDVEFPTVTYDSRYWHLTPEAAFAHARSMRAAAIFATEAQLKYLTQLVFELPKETADGQL